MRKQQIERRIGSVKLVRIDGKYRVWTKKIGNSSLKVLTLHGGPGLTHEYLECFEDFLPQADIEFYYYDQLGSGLSDRPNDVKLWTIERFRDEVEEVRQELELDDFFLYGHSWGGILGIEYALKYQRHLKALIISNMTASTSSYEKHLGELRQKFPLGIRRTMERYEAKEEYDAPEYQEAMNRYFYLKYMCRLEPWPESFVRSLQHENSEVFSALHGPNEFVATGTGRNWDRWNDLPHIKVPTLLMVGCHDTMSVQDVQKMGRLIPNSSLAVCRNGSHLSMYDDQQVYFTKLIRFIKTVKTSAR